MRNFFKKVWNFFFPKKETNPKVELQQPSVLEEKIEPVKTTPVVIFTEIDGPVKEEIKKIVVKKPAAKKTAPKKQVVKKTAKKVSKNAKKR